MPRVVPSDVVQIADQMFPDMATSPGASPNVSAEQVPSLAALVTLVESVPNELVIVEPRQYAGLMASIACLKAMGAVFQSKGVPSALPLHVRGFRENPVALIRAAMAACRDEAPSRRTTTLRFISEPALRESIRLDMNQDLAQGEWKGATVLAGSAVEALLLWALQEHERNNPGSVHAAVVALLRTKTIGRHPGSDLEGQAWHLHEYVEVAANLGVIKPDTATLVRLAKDFRNLIHPSRASRLGHKCDRATALGALAAVEAVARDLS